MKTTLVVLRIKDDNENRPWEDALGLPAFERWGLTLPEGVYVSLPVEFEKKEER